MAKNRKLGRTSDQRRGMLRNLATDVIMYGKIETTATRAKEVRSVVEELITLGKRGAVQKLFDDVAPKYKDQNGGYTKVLKTYNRKGDNATMAIITLL